MAERDPRITIVLPTHNRPKLLSEAIGSLLRQTRADWELIVVDDASVPAADVPGDPRVRVIRHGTPLGGAASKNTGVEQARSPVLAFLDDDDLLAPNYVGRALDVLERHSDLEVLFMGVTWFGSAGANGQENYNNAMSRTLARAAVGSRENSVVDLGNGLLDALLSSVPMAFQRPVVRRSAFMRVGPYRDDCLLWDCDWAIRAALSIRGAHIAEGLYLQRAEGQGYSSRGERRLAHIKSGIDIKRRLVDETQLGRYPRDLLPKFRAALADAWFELAWYESQRGHRLNAFDALRRSALVGANTRTIRLFLRLLYPWQTANRG